jgi:hypothetical protein
MALLVAIFDSQGQLGRFRPVGYRKQVFGTNGRFRLPLICCEHTAALVR